MNKTLEETETRDIMIGSMDMEALYPSIDQNEGAKIVARHVMQSNIQYEGLYIRKTALYLATVLNKKPGKGGDTQPTTNKCDK